MSDNINKLRSVRNKFTNWISITNYFNRWIVLGIILGVVAGLGAVLFYNALVLTTDIFLGYFANYKIPTPFSEGNSLGDSFYTRVWILPLVVAAGGLISGLIVYFVAPEAEGHGTDAAIEAVHHNPKGVGAKVIIAKILASAFMIGSGGSGGREGPSAQISAGIGSIIARFFRLSDRDSKIAVSIGIGAGIGSIFGAPFGGAVLSGEILYKDDIDGTVLLPSLLASIVGFIVFGLFEGYQPLFGFQAESYHFDAGMGIIWFALLGVICAGIGILYSKTFYKFTDISKSIKLPIYIKTLVGGLLVGLIAMFIPEVLGTGYGWIQKVLNYHQLQTIPIAVLIFLPILRILVTSLSIGSGGSGGIFGPGMVIGAFTGASFWAVLNHIVSVDPHNPGPFVVIGMLACFGSVARAPIAVTLMVLEMTGTITVLAPAVIAIGVASFIVKKFDVTIYLSQLQNRQTPTNKLSEKN